jgi:hypothetical protein
MLPVGPLKTPALPWSFCELVDLAGVSDSVGPASFAVGSNMAMRPGLHAALRQYALLAKQVLHI